MNEKLIHRGRKMLALLLCVLICAQGVLVLAETAVESQTPSPQQETSIQPPSTTTQKGDTATDTPKQSATADNSASGETPAGAAQTPGATPGVTPEAEKPTCDIPDCPHVTADKDGNTIAVCPLGEWMLAQTTPVPEAAGSLRAGAIMPMDATIPSDMTLPAGITNINRSGSYKLSGGDTTTEVTIADNLAVAIELNGATIGTLTLGSNVTLQLGFKSRNTINLLNTNSATILFNGLGSLTVSNVDDINASRLTMQSGSIDMPSGLKSANGNKQYPFDAAGATSATVDGAGVIFTMPDSSDKAYLWLSAPANGGKYVGNVDDGKLVITSEADSPAGAVDFDMSGAPSFVSAQDMTYNIIASSMPLTKTLAVNTTGVTLVFDGIDLGTTANVDATVPVRLHTQGNTTLRSISGSADVTLTGNGKLDVDTISLTTLNSASGIKLSYVNATGAFLTQWETLSVSTDFDTVTKLVYSGKAYAIAYEAGNTSQCLAPLPKLASGMKYEVVRKGNELHATQVPSTSELQMLGSGDIIIDTSGDYVITTDGAASGKIIVSPNVAPNITLRNVTTSGNLDIDDSASANVTLEGSNTVGVIMLGNATLTVAGTGALSCSSMSTTGAPNVTVADETNLTLLTGATLPNSSVVPTIIKVTGTNGAPMPNTALTIKVGTSIPFDTTTANNGNITLWGATAKTGVSVVVLSQADTYAAVISSGSGSPDALPSITNVEVSNNAITYSTHNANTSGVQYYIDKPNVTMPDTFDATALQAALTGGKVDFSDQPAGTLVSFRVFAARNANQTLNADTADAFQFTEMKSFVVGDTRPQFTFSNQSKEYDQKPFKFAAGVIPTDMKVHYYKDGVLVASPTDVGSYRIEVEVPSTNTNYRTGTSQGWLTIKRKLILIYPEEMGKLKGEPDPEYFYTYTELFGNDEITGQLRRVKGELYGNYPYLVSNLRAPDYYELQIDPDSPMFFIDWGPGHYIKLDPLAIINPVHQTLEYSDGTKLDLVLTTGEKLNISKVAYGNMVTDTEDGKTRPFTPELRLKRGYNQAMLIMQAEPEINKDGGYATDADGKLQLRGRTLSITPFHLSRFKSQRITTVGFRLSDTMCTLDLGDLLSDEVRAAMAGAGIPLTGTRFQVTLQPVNNTSDLNDYPQDAQDDKALGAAMMTVKLEVKNGANKLDISPFVPTANTLFDVSSLLAEEAETTPEISEVTIGRKDGEAIAEESISTDVMELVQKLAREKLKVLGTTMKYYGTSAQTLDSRLVVPYTASESEVFAYTAVMRTSPFLMVKLSQSGLYGISQTLWQ